MLGLAVCQCLIQATACAFEARNRTAGRFLAATLLVIAGKRTPYSSREENYGGLGLKARLAGR